MSLAASLVCPGCHGSLSLGAADYRCETCQSRYPITEGIAVFVTREAADHDEIDHPEGAAHATHAWPDAGGGGDAHKSAQAAYFDRKERAEFEIERPNGAPALYGFLLREKFRRGIEPLGRLDGWTALTVCGGSGLDAEFLAKAGASVISSDISLGAAKRSLERARRRGLQILPIVADVEHLPFPDTSIDLVYVHDGLHHLADPSAGLDEMVRVARRAVSITEPARSAVTNVAVRFGLALAREESGNLVARLRPGEVAAQLERGGFAVALAERYAMYYHHHPGRVMRVLSHRRILPAAVVGWRLANAMVGRRLGNKLSVTAVR